MRRGGRADRLDQAAIVRAHQAAKAPMMDQAGSMQNRNLVAVVVGVVGAAVVATGRVVA